MSTTHFLLPLALDPEVVHAQRLVLLRQENDATLRASFGFLETMQVGYITPDQRRTPIAAFPPAPHVPPRRTQRAARLFQVHEHLQYQSFEIFHLAVNFVDRICGLHPVHLGRYQTLGAACLLIAGKLCEPNPPSCKSLVDLACGAFTHETLRAEELLVLKRLRWKLSAATPSAFLELFLADLPLGEQHRQAIYEMADTFLAVIQLYYRMMLFSPSVQSAACILATFAATRSDCEMCYRHLARQINALSLDTSAMAMGLHLPSMAEIEECSKQTIDIARPIFPHFVDAKYPRQVLEEQRQEKLEQARLACLVAQERQERQVLQDRQETVMFSSNPIDAYIRTPLSSASMPQRRTSAAPAPDVLIPRMSQPTKAAKKRTRSSSEISMHSSYSSAGASVTAHVNHSIGMGMIAPPQSLRADDHAYPPLQPSHMKLPSYPRGEAAQPYSSRSLSAVVHDGTGDDELDATDLSFASSTLTAPEMDQDKRLDRSARLLDTGSVLGSLQTSLKPHGRLY
ncbi:hypothetical protein HK105_200617 [Polyrhizophydium stewartii]|uniref:Cyclin-like domain-containing protein n=1 Tax=Polyrhizophydium stewartii TaxID=2732419 RepID=A0ABR4NJJ3_9FUNG